MAEGESGAPEGVSPEELAEELRQIKVADLVVQSAVGLVQLGFIRLAGEQIDLAQARLAIDSLRVLEPIVREQVSVELGDELERAIVSLQLAFAEAVGPKTTPGPGAETATEPEGGEQTAAGSPDASS